MIHEPCHDKQQIGQPIDVRNHKRIVCRQAEPDNRTFGPAADGSRQVQERPGGRSPGQDEASQRRQLGLKGVDGLLQPRHIVWSEPRLVHTRGNAVGRIREHGADGEQIALNRREQLIQIGADTLGANEAQPRAQLIDITVGLHARIGF